jgi:hypothetical protein
MGIEPKRTLLRSQKNTAFRDSEKTACDWRANFRVMRDNVGLRETPPFAIESPLSTRGGGSSLSASGKRDFRGKEFDSLQIAML